MGEKEQYVVVSYLPPTGDLACKPGTCPDWESNGQLFGSGGSVIPVLRPTHNSHIFCFSTEPVRVPTLLAHSTSHRAQNCCGHDLSANVVLPCVCSIAGICGSGGKRSCSRTTDTSP